MSEKNRSIFTIASEYISEKWNEHQAEKERQKKQQEKQFLLRIIYEMMCQITVDFSETFTQEIYSLVPVETYDSVRIRNCKLTDGIYQYQFAIGKKSPDRISTPVLKEIQDHMNDNIRSTRNKLIMYFGQDTVRQMYPFLESGMCVVSVQNLKQLEVLVTIQTNITPEQWKQRYHQ